MLKLYTVMIYDGIRSNYTTRIQCNSLRAQACGIEAFVLYRLIRRSAHKVWLRANCDVAVQNLTHVHSSNLTSHLEGVYFSWESLSQRRSKSISVVPPSNP